jgi:hypothetical protein
MAQKNLMTQANDSSNHTVELLDEDLQQIVGGLHIIEPIVEPIVVVLDELPVGGLL